MASNETNRFQSLDSSVEEFIDGQETENTKKKTKHDFLFWKPDETNGRIDFSRAEQIFQRVPYNGSQNRRQRGIRAKFLKGILR